MVKKQKAKNKPVNKNTVTFTPPAATPRTYIGPDFSHPRLVGTLLGRTFNHVKMMDGTYLLAFGG